MNLTNQDIAQLTRVGISKETIKNQYNNLVSGPQELNLLGPCVINHGILAIPDGAHEECYAMYNELSKGKDITMFTPASGAATRMFKHLINPQANPKLYREFQMNIEKFSFYPELVSKGCTGFDASLKCVLNEDGLNYANLPKAMISFHAYGEQINKAIDDQLVEGLKYLTKGNTCKFHFTISPEHKNVVSTHVDTIIPTLEKENNVRVEVTYSYQEKSTDTIALHLNGEVVRDEKGALVLRPGGHGALIHNLNDLDTDIIFIKNIDNIARQEYHDEVANYKRIIGAQLLKFQDKVFEILHEIESEVTDARLAEISSCLELDWNVKVAPKKQDIFNALNKPIRVCGMVKNEGKAGGGPFWIGNSMQIVESAQMNLSDPAVKQMVEKATHFNPVDIVCGVKSYKGEKFDLLKYVDDTAFFVSQKSYNGQDIKVLEHPGLWNGAMAKWLTLFVEVPVTTFNPVKTVNDLLLPQHCVE